MRLRLVLLALCAGLLTCVKAQAGIGNASLVSVSGKGFALFFWLCSLLAAGVSSGAMAANQFHVAYSKSVMGVGESGLFRTSAY
jgi:hypothetical protein